MVNDLTEARLEEVFRSPIENIPGDPSRKNILYSRLSLFCSYLFSDKETFLFMDERRDVMFFDWLDDLSVLEVIELWKDFDKNLNKQRVLLPSQAGRVREKYSHEFQRRSILKVREYIDNLDPSRPVIGWIQLIFLLEDLRGSNENSFEWIEVIQNKLAVELYELYDDLKLEYGGGQAVDADSFYFYIVTTPFEEFKNNIITYQNKAEKVLVWIKRFHKLFNTESIPTLPKLKSESKLIVEHVYAPYYYDTLVETIQTIRVKKLSGINIVEDNLNSLKASGKLSCQQKDIQNFLKLFTAEKDVFSPAICQFQWEDFTRKEFREMMRRWNGKLEPKPLKPFCETVPTVLNYPYEPESLRDYLRKNPPISAHL